MSWSKEFENGCTEELLAILRHELRHGNEFDEDVDRDLLDEIERLQSELAAERELSLKMREQLSARAPLMPEHGFCGR
jgi:hypothetical protein